jgi:hypothetical protein
MIDMTGQPPSNQDVEDAIKAVTSVMVNPKTMLSLPPELIVNLPNIRRCLMELRKLR